MLVKAGPESSFPPRRAVAMVLKSVLRQEVRKMDIIQQITTTNLEPFIVINIT